MKKQKVLELFGTNTALADFLDIRPQYVSAWKDDIPDHFAYELHVRTNGVLPLDLAETDHPYKRMDYEVFVQKYKSTKVSKSAQKLG